MKRTPLRPSSSPIRANRTRKAKEFGRVYGSRARIEWIQTQRCVVGGCWGFCQNVHVETDGMGRKADYTKVVPMCYGHHRQLHDWGIDTFNETYCHDLTAAAARTQAAWEAHAA